MSTPSATTMLLKPSAMGPFTLSQLVPCRNGSATKEDQDAATAAAKNRLASPKPSSINTQGDGKRVTESCGGTTARLQQKQEPRRKKLSKPKTKDVVQDGSIPFLGDLDSSDEEGEGAPKSLEHTACNLLAQAVKKPAHGYAQNRAAPQYSSAAAPQRSSATDLDLSGKEGDYKEKKPKSLEQTTYDMISQATKWPGPASGVRPIRSSLKSMGRTSATEGAHSQSNSQPKDVSQKTEDSTSKRLESKLERQRRNEDVPRVEGKEEEKEESTAQRLARGLARQRSKEAIASDEDLGYYELGEGRGDGGGYVRKNAPRRYSSGGKPDAKLQKGSNTPRSGPVAAPVGAGCSVTTDQESQSDTCKNGFGRFQRRRMMGRRGPGSAHKMQRSSSVSNILVKEKQRLSHSLHASLRSYDELERVGYEDQHQCEPALQNRMRRGSSNEYSSRNTEDPYGRRPQHQQEVLSDDSLGRRLSGGYGRDLYLKDDSERETSLQERGSLGYGDAHPDKEPSQREGRRSLGYGVMTEDSDREPNSRVQRRSMGCYGERESILWIEGRSIGFGGATSEDSELEGGRSIRQPIKGRKEGDQSEREPSLQGQPSLRGQRSGTGDSQRGSNSQPSCRDRSERGTSVERNPVIRGQSSDRNSSSRGKQRSTLGLESSRHGQQLRQSQVDRESSLRRRASCEHKQRIPSECEVSVRGRRNGDVGVVPRSSLEEKARLVETQKNPGRGRLDAKMAKQHRREKRASICSSGSQGSLSSGDQAKRSGRHQVFPQNVRRSNSDGMASSGKLDQKLSRGKGARQRKFDDSFRSGNSEQSGDSLGSSRSERSAKLGRMLNRDVRNKRRSFHDSLKSGTSNGSSESALTTHSGPAATGKWVRGKVGKKKEVRSCSGSPQPDGMDGDASNERCLKYATENSQSCDSDVLGASVVRSIHNCHTTFGRAQHGSEVASNMKECSLVRSASSILLGAVLDDEGLVVGINRRPIKGKGKLGNPAKNQGLPGFIPKHMTLDEETDDNPLEGDDVGSRNSLKTNDSVLVRRSYSLTDGRSVSGNNVVRSFSMRNVVGGLLHSDHWRNNDHADDASVKDDIISYGSDGYDDDDDKPTVDSHCQAVHYSDHEDDAERKVSYTLRPQMAASPACNFLPGESRKSSGEMGNIVATVKIPVGLHGDEDACSSQTDSSDESADLWDEFENGSMVDSDSRSSSSDKAEDMLSLSGSGRIINWGEDEEKPDYLNPAMSLINASFCKTKPTARIAIEGMPPPVAVSNKSIGKQKKPQSRRQSLLGGFQLEDEDDIAESIAGASVHGPSVLEDWGIAKRQKKKKCKKDVVKSSVDKFDWEGKAKEDKKRENKKKKKEPEDDLTVSQHSKKERKIRRAMSTEEGNAGREKMKRASSMKGFGKFTALDLSSKKNAMKTSSNSKLYRSQSVELDESTGESGAREGKRSRFGSNDNPKQSPKSEKKRRATTTGLMSGESGILKTRRRSRSKSPLHLSSMDESKSAHLTPDRARSSRRRKSVDRNPELKRSNTSTDVGELKSRSNAGTVSKSKSKGVRRAKSLCAEVDGVKYRRESSGESKPRATSVKRSSSSNMKKNEDAPKRSKSNLRKKKAANEQDSSERRATFLRLLEEDPVAACGLVDKDPSLAEARGKDGCFPLHIAAQRDLPVEVMEKLIEAYPEACDAQCDKGFTPLHFAVEANTPTPKIKVLIKACPRALKTQDRKGQVPLHIAVSHGARLSSVRLLVFIYPESVDIETSKGETARKIAKRKKASPEILNELKVVDLVPASVAPLGKNRRAASRC